MKLKKKKLLNTISKLVKERDQAREDLYTLLDNTNLLRIEQIKANYNFAKDLELSLWYGNPIKTTDYDKEMAKEFDTVAQSNIITKKRRAGFTKG